MILGCAFSAVPVRINCAPTLHHFPLDSIDLGLAWCSMWSPVKSVWPLTASPMKSEIQDVAPRYSSLLLPSLRSLYSSYLDLSVPAQQESCRRWTATPTVRSPDLLRLLHAALTYQPPSLVPYSFLLVHCPRSPNHNKKPHPEH